MKIGIKNEKFEDLNEIDNLLKLNELNCQVSTADFKTKITSVTKPFIGSNFVPLHFELRGNYEICVVGRLNDILEYFKLSIVREIPNGYELGIQKEGEDELRRNPKSCKFYANICNYERNFLNRLKRDYFNADKDELFFFYRTDIYLLDEEKTIKLLKEKQSYKNFNKFAIHTIKRQNKLHKIFNIPYKLNINVTLIEDSPKYKEETSLSFNIEDDNTISLSGTYDHVSSFIEQYPVSINLNIQEDNTTKIVEERLSNDNKWTLKGLLASTFRTNKSLEVSTQ